MKFVYSMLFIFFSVFLNFGAVTVDVKPINQKQTTGLYIKKGDSLKIKVSGKWSLWDKYKLTDGEGHPVNAGEYGNWGRLLGKIGGGPVFAIGNGIDITSSVDEGVLYLFPNKGKYLIDKQSGSLSVSVDGGTKIEDYLTSNLSNANKYSFDPKDGLLTTDLYFDEGETIEFYAIGSWTMWKDTYLETNAEGHTFEFTIEQNIPWGKLYGGLGSTFGQFSDIFSIGERTTIKTTKSGVLTLYPYIGNYVSDRYGKMDIYILGGRPATEDDKKAADDIAKESVQSQVLDKINEFRKTASLPDLELNPILSQSAYDHAKYLAINNVFTRDESSDLTNYTGVTVEDRVKNLGYEGKVREMFCLVDSPVSATEILSDSVYHRLRLLDPELKFIGFGSYKSQDRTINVFDFGYAAESDAKLDWEKLLYPAADSVGVKVDWNGLENPDPFIANTSKPLGYPVTIALKDQFQKLNLAELVNDKGTIVDCFVITPENDINSKQFNAIVLVPKLPLTPGIKYKVNVKVVVGADNQEKTYSYSFETLKK